ncbi:acetate--CoA ligase family protein [Bordetella sp. BOR01]|uniref:acetate--CoA ligase family protein n=1 Tax=Bordetella sp. BOR01 TaxID=2854779 RepID=UPI001C438FB7|nr:acetate--CoA ligase family protein [Bordetella sp. BOR01]MBV7483570.1 acetate--CoA ligase family protein [Bordetella sp. BOR01]
MKPFADLARFINPVNVAVVGASGRPSSQGGRLYENLVHHSRIQGKVYAVNPAYTQIGDAPCWPSVRELPDDAIDVALVIVNATRVLDTLRQCAERKIPYAIVMSSGFSEAGEAGRALEQDIAQLCRDTGLHVYGPNCPGFVNVRDRVGMTFSPAFRHDLNAGSIGLATQGGGLGRNLLQGLAHGEGVGLWFSAGNEVDLEIPDFVACMAQDPQIKVIGLLMEGIKDGRRLTVALEMARQRGKPVVVLKIGHSEAGIRAAQSHTASIAGSAAINSAVFRQFGAIEVDDLDQLLAVARLLALGSPKPGTGLGIYTFSGGTAALTTDIAGMANLPMAVFTDQTNAKLKSLLPDFANIANPVDTTADILRDQDAANECLRVICNDPNVGAVLFPIPMDYGEVTDGIAQSIIEVSKSAPVPIIPVWMSRRMGGGFQLLEQHGLQPFLSVSGAIAALSRIWPPSGKPSAAASAHQPTVAGASVPAGHACGRQQTSEAQAKALLRQAGLPMPRNEIATSARQAAAAAAGLGFPVVMKIVSPDIAHKTECGGVRLDINSEAAAAAAFDSIRAAVQQAAPHARIDGVLVEAMLPAGGHEVLVGVHRDTAFGLVLTFGLGGIFVETLRDAAHRLIPLQRQDAHDLIREIRNAAILQGVRGQPPGDLSALEDLILKVSAFAESHADTLLELELNPVWVGPAGQGAVPLDALIATSASVEQPIATAKESTV